MTFFFLTPCPALIKAHSCLAWGIICGAKGPSWTSQMWSKHPTNYTISLAQRLHSFSFIVVLGPQMTTQTTPGSALRIPTAGNWVTIQGIRYWPRLVAYKASTLYYWPNPIKQLFLKIHSFLFILVFGPQPVAFREFTFWKCSRHNLVPWLEPRFPTYNIAQAQ